MASPNSARYYGGMPAVAATVATVYAEQLAAAAEGVEQMTREEAALAAVVAVGPVGEERIRQRLQNRAFGPQKAAEVIPIIQVASPPPARWAWTAERPRHTSAPATATATEDMNRAVQICIESCPLLEAMYTERRKDTACGVKTLMAVLRAAWKEGAEFSLANATAEEGSTTFIIGLWPGGYELGWKTRTLYRLNVTNRESRTSTLRKLASSERTFYFSDGNASELEFEAILHEITREFV